MGRVNAIAGLLLLGVSLTALEAHAEGGFIDEFRFGGTWAQPDGLDTYHPEIDQIGITGEVLFAPLNFDTRADASDDFIHTLLTPRFHIGGTVNLDDHGTSYAYTGLTWHYGLTERLFVEASFGGSINNGKKNGELDANLELVRARLGSNVMFRESLALGFYVTENVTALLQIDHNSHASLADNKNRGLTAIHLKAGYKF